MKNKPGTRRGRRGVLKARDRVQVARLRVRRTGFNQVEFAEHLGVGVATISRLERGENVDEETAKLVSSVLGEPVGNLFAPPSYGDSEQALEVLSEPDPRVAPPLRASGVGMALEAFNTDTFVRIAQAVLRTELASERGKTGEILALHASRLPGGPTELLMDAALRWLDSPGQRLLIIGDAGSGKSLFCLTFVTICLTRFTEQGLRLPVFIDLRRYTSLDSALDILESYFLEHEVQVTRSQLQRILREGKLLIVLDSFDEYDKGSLAGVSSRSLDDFEQLCGHGSKVMVLCRTNLFTSPTQIQCFDTVHRGFDLCPPDSLVMRIEPLPRESVEAVLAKASKATPLPLSVIELAQTPLFLRMLIPLLESSALASHYSRTRHELYEQYIEYLLAWEAKRKQAVLTTSQARQLHVRIAINLLIASSPMVTQRDLSHAVKTVLEMPPLDTHFSDTIWALRKSALFRLDSAGDLYYAHKSFREYLVARYIYDLITSSDDTFDFLWFTRHERDFLAEMINERDYRVLIQWLDNESKYPACNFAAFILGGTGRSEFAPYLSRRFERSTDPLVRMNCANSLGFLGDAAIAQTLYAAIAGYVRSWKGDCEHIVVSDATNDWFSDITVRFGRPVALIHLCETLSALYACVGSEIVVVCGILKHSPDIAVVEEVKALVTQAALERGS